MARDFGRGLGRRLFEMRDTREREGVVSEKEDTGMTGTTELFDFSFQFGVENEIFKREGIRTNRTRFFGTRRRRRSDSSSSRRRRRRRGRRRRRRSTRMTRSKP